MSGMTRRFRGMGLMQEPQPPASSFATTMDIPVLLQSASGLTVVAIIYVTPQGKATRRAVNQECALSIWVGASGGANQAKMPPLNNGGWNKGPVVRTNSDGIATITAPIPGAQWIRILAEHAASGAQVARGVWVDQNSAYLDTLTAPLLVRAGTPMQADFAQAPQSAPITLMQDYGMF